MSFDNPMDINTLILLIFYIVILVYSIILHEVFHGYVALWLGDLTAKYSDRLNFNPIKHIDPWGSIFLPLFMLVMSGFHYAFGWAKPVPYNPYNLKNQKWGPALVAIGGPASNIVLALLAVIIAKIMPIANTIKAGIIFSVKLGNWDDLYPLISGSFSSIFFVLLMMIIFWNVILAFFNLIPFPPLDGSKILFAIFPVSTEKMIIFEQYGFIFLIMFMFLFYEPLGIFLNFVLNLFFGLTL